MTTSDDTTNLLNVSIIGDGAVGKTSLVTTFLHGEFFTDYDPTIDETYDKTQHIKEIGKDITFRLYDMGGCWHISPTQWDELYRDQRDIIFILFSVDCILSYQNVFKYWLPNIQNALANDENNNRPFVKDTVLYIVSNKMDLPEKDHKVNVSDAAYKARENDAYFMETSCKTGQNIDRLFTQAGTIFWQRNRKKSRTGVPDNKKKNCCIL